MSSERIAAAAVSDILDLRWRVLRKGRPPSTAHMPGDDLPTTRHWAVWHDDEVVACATVMADPYPAGSPPIDPLPAFRLRGMAVSEAVQRQGVGRRLLDVVQRDVARPMWCDARLHAVPFYEAAGWAVCSDVYDVPQVGPHKRMVWPGAAA